MGFGKEHPAEMEPSIAVNGRARSSKTDLHGFLPKLGAPPGVFPRMKILVVGGLYWGPRICGKSHVAGFATGIRKARGRCHL